jgi:biotin transport system substrate-specific component
VESRAIARIALLAAVIAVLGMLPSMVLPIAAGVPITAQTLGVMLAGVVLGPRHGALAVLLFVFVVLLGAPLLAGGRGGLGVLFGPSVGYLIGFVPAAYVAGLVMARLKTVRVFVAALVAAVVGGIVVEHLCGVIGLMAIARVNPLQALAATAVFVPGDVLKALAAAFVAEAAYRSYPAAIACRS